MADALEAALARKQREEDERRKRIADMHAAQREWNTLVYKEGVPPAEAYLKLGARLGPQGPSKFRADQEAFEKTQPPPAPPPTPYPTNYPGVPGQFIVETDRFGQTKAERVIPPSATADKPALMPPEVAAAQEMRKANAASLRRALENKTSRDTNRLAQLEAEVVRGATNYPGYKPPVTATESPAPFKDGTVLRNKKDKKLYRIENGVPVLLNE